MSSPGSLHHGWVRARRNVDKARGRVRRLAREEHLRLLLLAAMVGVVSGLGAVVVKEMISGVQWLFWGAWADVLVSSAEVPWWRGLGSRTCRAGRCVPREE